jgi:prepilin signal peptidase PulO-like enzyme (type II secretory pathway)
MLDRRDVVDALQKDLVGQLRPRLSCQVHHEHILIVVAFFLYSLFFWLGCHSRALTWSINSLAILVELFLITFYIYTKLLTLIS